MHELFANVLAKRDLASAGELFSIEDAKIVADLTDVLLEISIIIAQPRYLESTNDQSTIEICVNRCTSCIRETDTAERHCSGLVQLLETCLLFNHKPQSKRSEDPPHAKISADVISCIFLNYNKKAVMELSLPVAVKFLNKENKELSKNLASYLSLAAIEYTDLLVPFVDIILNSLLNGNYSLARVVLQLYDISNILPKCDTIDKNILLQLIATISTTNNGISMLILDKLPQFFDLILANSSGVLLVLTILLRLAEKKPAVFHEYIGILILTAQKHPNSQTICLVGQILSAIGKKNKEKAQMALEFIMENLQNTERSAQTTLLQEAVKLCSQYPILFNDKLTAVIRHRNLSQQSLLTSKKPNSQSTSGNITITSLNSTATSSNLASRTSQNVPLKSQAMVGSGAANHQQHQQNHHQHQQNQQQQQQQSHPSNSQQHNSIPTSNNTQHYSRRPKFGDSRSTGRLHNGNGTNAHRSMTRLNASGVNNSNLGGLHKSMTRLSSSQQINQTQNPVSNGFNSNDNSFISPTIPPLSQNVMITGENKWGIPSTKITSCGVTVNHTSPTRIRPFSQGPNTLGSIGKSSSNGLSVHQSTGSISMQNNISVHHAMPLNSQQSSSSLAPPISLPVVQEASNQVIVSGPTTVTSRKSANKSVTLLNANRVSVFEPSMRDTIQHFCEKHLDKIKAYMKTVAHRLPPPAKCTIEERRAKKFAKLHFACQARGAHCLYSKTFFSMRTRHAKVWIHLMFLDLQSRSDHALSSYDSSVASLKHCWDTLKFENRTFITLVTSAFPPVRDQDALLNELRSSGFFDVFEIGPMENNSSYNSLDEDVRWGCFLCNHPEKALFLESNTQPVIEGQLKEKKGRWRIFRRWRTKYFTLSGAHLSCKGSSGDASIDINQIRSVKVSRGARNIPTAFEIFTSTNQTLILKPTDGEKAEEWVQYLSIVVARHSQAARDGFTKSNSLPSSGSRREINSRTAF